MAETREQFDAALAELKDGVTKLNLSVAALVAKVNQGGDFTAEAATVGDISAAVQSGIDAITPPPSNLIPPGP